MLDWLGEEDYRTTFVCKRDEETGESRICALTDVPGFAAMSPTTRRQPRAVRDPMDEGGP